MTTFIYVDSSKKLDYLKLFRVFPIDPANPTAVFNSFKPQMPS